MKFRSTPLLRCATGVLYTGFFAVTAAAADGEFRTRPDFRAVMTPIEVENPGVFGDRVLAARIVAVNGSTACRR